MRTVVAVIYDLAAMAVHAVIIPDDDQELDDPAYNPQGHIQMRVALELFQAGGLEAVLAEVPAALALAMGEAQ